jgi:hypothetical protein
VNADDSRDARRDGHEPSHEEPGFDELGLDDPDHAWVTEVLAEAGVTEPVPDDVAARLDETLAALQAHRSADLAASEPSGVAPVVPLRRRLGRRVGPGLVAAAVAVVVVGGGIGLARTAHHADSGAARTADSAGSTADRQSESSHDSAASEPPATAAKTVRGLPRLTSASFGADAARLMQQVAGSPTLLDLPSEAAPSPADGVPGTTATSGSTTTSGSAALQAPPVTATPGPRFDVRGAAPCQGPTIAHAVTLPATLDGARVALVFLPPAATGQRVEAWSCDGASLLADATVPR